MDFDLDQVAIDNNEDAHRFEARVGEHLAMAEYTLTRQNVIVFTHTEVPPALEGQGLAVMPLCPFVKAFILRHPDYRDLVTPGFHM